MFKDKVVVITGGATGIGKAAAQEFLREGARVAILGRRKEPLEAFAREAKEEGYEIYHESCDVTDRAAVQAFADRVAESFGSLGFLMPFSRRCADANVRQVWREETASFSNADTSDTSDDMPERFTEAWLLFTCVYVLMVLGAVRKRGRFHSNPQGGRGRLWRRATPWH